MQEFINQGNASVIGVHTSKDLSECFDLMSKYQDNPMGFADATLVVIAGKLDINNVFTLDVKNFNSYRIS